MSTSKNVQQIVNIILIKCNQKDHHCFRGKKHWYFWCFVCFKKTLFYNKFVAYGIDLGGECELLFFCCPNYGVIEKKEWSINKQTPIKHEVTCNQRELKTKGQCCWIELHSGSKPCWWFSYNFYAWWSGFEYSQDKV